MYVQVFWTTFGILIPIMSPLTGYFPNPTVQDKRESQNKDTALVQVDQPAIDIHRVLKLGSCQST